VNRESIHRDPAEERIEPADWDKLNRTLVIGCGNVLMGDDGLGPTFIKQALKQTAGSPLANEVTFIDAGTSIRSLLFSIVLTEPRPERIIIVDAVDVGRAPGEVFEISLDDIPAVKSDDFSMHQLPTSNLLKELREQCGVEVRVVAVQVEYIPKEIRCGLSEPLLTALPKLQETVFGLLTI